MIVSEEFYEGVVYAEFCKKLSDNYKQLKQFIDVHFIHDVVILGHSIFGIDEPYYRHIIVSMLKDRHWEIYWHKTENEARELANKYGLVNVTFTEW